MTLPLFITTLGRLDSQITLRNIRRAADMCGYPVTLVVQGHEYNAHRERYPDVNVMALPVGIDNLRATREYMFDHFGDGKFVLLDDDMDFYTRADPADWHLTTPTDEQLAQMLREVDEALDTYHHVGISGREGNNRVPDYSVESTRFMRFLAYARIPADVRPRVDGMSDFDVNLQLLRRGLPSLVFYRYAQGHKGTQTPGGCSLTRSHATHEAECARMQELHPGLVSPRQKQNKTGGGFLVGLGLSGLGGAQFRLALGFQLAGGFQHAGDRGGGAGCLPGFTGGHGHSVGLWHGLRRGARALHAPGHHISIVERIRITHACRFPHIHPLPTAQHHLVEVAVVESVARRLVPVPSSFVVLGVQLEGTGCADHTPHAATGQVYAGIVRAHEVPTGNAHRRSLY